MGWGGDGLCGGEESCGLRGGVGLMWSGRWVGGKWIFEGGEEVGGVELGSGEGEGKAGRVKIGAGKGRRLAEGRRKGL